jgi:hypothetical protein
MLLGGIKGIVVVVVEPAGTVVDDPGVVVGLLALEELPCAGLVV